MESTAPRRLILVDPGGVFWGRGGRLGVDSTDPAVRLALGGAAEQSVIGPSYIGGSHVIS